MSRHQQTAAAARRSPAVAIARRSRTPIAAAVVVAATVLGGAASALAASPSTERISVATGGVVATSQGSGTYNPPQSGARLASADGRYVAFESEAHDLVAGDTNRVSDVFVRDRREGTTVRVSVGRAGRQANGSSTAASVSANGRFVAFASLASNLVAGDTNGIRDIFVHDRATRITTRVSVTSSGAQVDQRFGNNAPAISADGRHVAFVSYAPDLAPGATTGKAQVFVHDRKTRATTLASVAANGEESHGVETTSPAISADGRYVAFAAPSAGNLLMGHPDSSINVFVRDRHAGTTERVSLRSDGTNGGRGQVHSQRPSISADGRYVAFDSTAPDLVDGDPNGGQADVFVHDRATRETTRVSVAGSAPRSDYLSEAPATWPSISADGRYVAFETAVARPTGHEVFRHDRLTGATIRVSVGAGGVRGDARAASISGDGRHVVFTSHTSKLVAGPSVGWRQVFVRDTASRWRAPAPRVQVVNRTVKARGRLALKSRGIADGQKLVVRWAPRKGTAGRAVRVGATVRGSRATVAAPRARGRYTVQVTLRGRAVGNGAVRVR